MTESSSPTTPITCIAKGTEVHMQDKAGAPDKSETAGKIINLLYEQLK